MTCKRCGIHVPRTTLTQRYCEPCARDVEAILSRDAARQTGTRSGTRWHERDNSFVRGRA